MLGCGAHKVIHQDSVGVETTGVVGLIQDAHPYITHLQEQTGNFEITKDQLVIMQAGFQGRKSIDYISCNTCVSLRKHDSNKT